MEDFLLSIDTLVDWVQANGWLVVAAQYVFSCFTQALIDPATTSHKLYIFAFRFAHLLAGNVNVVRKPLKGEI